MSAHRSQPELTESASGSSVRRHLRVRRGRIAASGAVIGGLAVALALFATAAGAQTAAPNGGQFATGSVTSIDGSSLQVSNANNETTVVVAGTTSFVKRETGTASSIAVGDCVTVTGTTANKGIKAANVSVTAAASTGCTRGAGGGPGGAAGAGGGARFGGGTGQRPNFGNGERPAGGFGGANANRLKNLGIAFGPVQSVSGDKMVVKATTFTRPTKKNAKPKTTTKDVTVTLTSSTNISQTVAATAADLTVGSCVTARGPLVSGAVNATNVTISSPVNGACTAGFGGFGGGRFGGGGNGGGSNTTTSAGNGSI